MEKALQLLATYPLAVRGELDDGLRDVFDPCRLR